MKEWGMKIEKLAESATTPLSKERSNGLMK